MTFKNFYCAKCGAKLEKECTHRVVTKGDQDYYRYQSPGRFPQRDWDVYDYRFRCPSCNTRMTYDDQCIIERIQKKQGKAILSADEIKSHYQEGKKTRSKRMLLRNVSVSAGFVLLSFWFYCMRDVGEDPNRLLAPAIISLTLAVITAVDAVKKYKGDYRSGIRGGYSYETEMLLQKLHTYSTHNKALVESADMCWCFYCKKATESSKIKAYADNGQTAICPKCGIDAILPDSIEETLDDNTVSLMNKYWF